MKLSKLQYYSLLGMICAMVFGIMAMAFVMPTYKPENDTVEATESSDEQIPIVITEIVTEREIAQSEEMSTEVTSEIIEETSEITEPVENSITANWDDVELMARCVWAEARGESYAGQVAVAEVILNRVSHHDFPDTVYDVIYEPGQFTTASSLPYATPSQTQYDAVYDALNGNGVLNNGNCVYFSVGRSCGEYYTTIGNHVFGLEF